MRQQLRESSYANFLKTDAQSAVKVGYLSILASLIDASLGEQLALRLLSRVLLSCRRRVSWAKRC